ncbi:hypothetical protein D9M68_712140 [compost metagenome]
MEGGSREHEWGDRLGLHGLPVDDLLPARTVEGIERRVGATAFVGGFEAGDAGVDVDDLAVEACPRAHQLVEDDQQPVQHHDFGFQFQQPVEKAFFEEALALGALRGIARVAPVRRRNGDQEIVQQSSLHLQFRGIEPLLVGLVREAVILDLLAVAGRVDVVIVDHPFERIEVPQRRPVQ